MKLKTILIIGLMISTILLSGCEYDRDALSLDGKCNYDVAHSYCENHNLSYVSYSSNIIGTSVKCKTSCGVINKVKLNPKCEIRIISE